MNRNDSFTCPDCFKKNTVKGTQSYLLCCYNCGQVLSDETSKGIKANPVPEDFSIIQIGTTGIHKSKSFEVIGQIRMQLQREYKTLWYVWYSDDDSYGWLSESYSHYSMCPAIIYRYGGYDLVFGELAKISDKITVVPSYFDECAEVSYCGELRLWDYFSPGFTFVAGSTTGNIDVLFFTYSGIDNIQFLIGEEVTANGLALKNIKEYNEWNG